MKSVLCRRTLALPFTFVGDISSLRRRSRRVGGIISHPVSQKKLLHCITPEETGHFQNDPIPQISFKPLFERCPNHRYTVKEVFSWTTWAQSMALQVGKKYMEADGGPSSEELLKELEWMIEDGFSMKWREIKDLHAHESVIVYSRARLEEFSSLWTQRVQDRRPFQYVVGCVHWRDYVLCVKEGVLIPRPETEQMIDLAQEVVRSSPHLSKGLWVDMGTGSGAIAIGLGHFLDPESVVLAVDNCVDALSIASLNVRRYGLQNKVKIVRGSWFSSLEDRRGTIAGVLSNPPYIPSSCLHTLQAEVGIHEPHKALDGGDQGIDDLNVICDGAAWALQKDGCLILETNGGGQAEIIAERLEQGPFYNVHIVKDYAGISRFVKALHA